MRTIVIEPVSNPNTKDRAPFLEIPIDVWTGIKSLCRSVGCCALDNDIVQAYGKRGGLNLQQAVGLVVARAERDKTGMFADIDARSLLKQFKEFVDLGLGVKVGFASPGELDYRHWRSGTGSCTVKSMPDGLPEQAIYRAQREQETVA